MRALVASNGIIPLWIRASSISTTGCLSPLLRGATTTAAQQHHQQRYLGIRGGGSAFTTARRSFSLRATSERLTVVLDMDECLVHSRFEDMRSQHKGLAHQLLRHESTGAFGSNGSTSYPAGSAMGQVMPDLEDVRHNRTDFFWLDLGDGARVRVNKRPRVEEFLQRLSDDYDTYVFTAASEEYANSVLDTLDPMGTVFKGRFFRSSCKLVQGMYLKDLRVIKEDLSRLVLVDNNIVSFIAQPSNGIPVSSFYDDPEDDELHQVADMIDEHLSQVDDVRPRLRELYRLDHQLHAVRKKLALRD